MATFLRRPFALSGAVLKELPKSSSASSATRSFHSGAFFTASRPSALTSRNALSATRFAAFSSTSKAASGASSSPLAALRARGNNVLQSTFRRTYMNQGYQAAAPNAGNLTQRLLYGAGIFGGTLVAINFIFNRETREDGGMPPFERSFLNETFLHTGLGVGIIGIAARALHMNGWSYRLMAMNPWMVMGLSLVASIGTMYGTFNTHPSNYVQKYALWAGFNLTQAALLSPLMFMSPALLARAGLYTVAMMGSIAFVGATAKQEKYLYLGGPLLAGVAIVAVSGLAPLVLPATAVRTLALSEKLWLYGGLAVFGGFTLYDIQKILYHARLADRGLIPRDVVNESVSLELDFLNIFIRMVQILGMRQNNRR